MTARNAVLALALLCSGSIAASAAGDNVLLITVNKVTLPAKLPGLCNVGGTVSQVWDGKAFHPGQAISLKVPCSGGASYLVPAVAVLGPADGLRFISADVLKKSKRGFARIDDTGALIWEYSKRSYGPWGAAGGYRVLDGAAVPATPGNS